MNIQLNSVTTVPVLIWYPVLQKCKEYYKKFKNIIVYWMVASILCSVVNPNTKNLDPDMLSIMKEKIKKNLREKLFSFNPL